MSITPDWPGGIPPFAPAMGVWSITIHDEVTLLGLGFAAVVDGTSSGLPDLPINLIRQGRINRGPVSVASNWPMTPVYAVWCAGR